MAAVGRVAALLALAICAMLAYGQAARIGMLVYPSATSHQMIFAKVAKELVRRGHTVVLMRTNVDSKKVDTSGLEVFEHQTSYSREDYKTKWAETTRLPPLEGLRLTLKMQHEICRGLFEDDQLFHRLNSLDAMLIDPTLACFNILAGRANITSQVYLIPVNFYSPYLTEPYGISNNLGYVPMSGTGLTPDMDLAGRIKNVITWLTQQLVINLVIKPSVAEMRQSFGLEARPWPQPSHEIGLILLPTHWAIDFPRQITPNVKLVGPILPEPGQPLPGNIEAIYSKAENGVVVVSFGTLALLPSDLAQTLADAFAQLPYTFIWKHNGAKPKLGPNTVIVDWMPQNDMLADKRTRLFVMHGGVNGMMEAAYHGVPVVGMPLFVDQWDNVMRAVHVGLGLRLDKATCTVADVVDKIQQVIGNPKYREAAATISRHIHDNGGKTPTENVADWMEYSIRHNGIKYQTMPLRHFETWSNHALDAWLIIIGGAIAVLAGLIFGCISILRCLCCRKRAQGSHSKKND